MEQLNFDRIRYLFNPEIFNEIKITAIGLGSGGAPIVDSLVMNGIQNWDLYDMDTLDDVNLIKHPRMRKDLGKDKVVIQKEWIMDRNPLANVKIFNENIEESIKNSDFVLICTDNEATRYFLNDISVKYNKPYSLGYVYRTGFGGFVYLYDPSTTGCYSCYKQFLKNSSNTIDIDLALPLTEDEQSQIYGLDNRNYRASGLSIDIQMIALLHAKITLVFLANTLKIDRFPKLNFNYLTFSTRPMEELDFPFNGYFNVQKYFLSPQKLCCHYSEHENSIKNFISNV
mgnify:CR=1 FL=1